MEVSNTSAIGILQNHIHNWSERDKLPERIKSIRVYAVPCLILIAIARAFMYFVPHYPCRYINGCAWRGKCYGRLHTIGPNWLRTLTGSRTVQGQPAS